MNQLIRAHELIEAGHLAIEDGNHGEYRPRPNEFNGDGVPFIRAADINGGRVDFGGAGHINDDARQRIRKGVGRPGDTLLSHKGTVGLVARAPHNAPDYVCSPQTTFWRSLDADVLDPGFLRYSLEAPQFQGQLRAIERESDMAAYVSLTQQRLLWLNLPEITEQRAIAEVLGALDDKIAANEQILTTAAQLEDALFRAAVADSGARTQRVGEVATFLNRRRIPLSSRERSERCGTVPYYGAAGRIDYVDEPLFNEPIVLVGEDGTVQTEDGLAVVQYVWGPSWVNNHAHVLVGKTVATDLLRVALRGLCVADAVTGAVQPKLSMSRLSSLTLLLPEEPRVQELTEILAASAGVIRATAEENRSLAALRDALLPELMSGRLRVKDAEKTVEEVV